MLFPKMSEEKKEFMKADIIEKIEFLAIARRTAHEAGWEYEEIDRWITEEAREQFARFEAKSSKDMTIFLKAKMLKALTEEIKEGEIELHVEEVDE